MGGTAGQRRAEKLERESSKAEAASNAKKKAEDDAYWAAAGDGSKSKAQAKRDASDAAADAAAASKAEAKRLAKLEEEEMSSVSKIFSDTSLLRIFFLFFFCLGLIKTGFTSNPPLTIIEYALTI